MTPSNWTALLFAPTGNDRVLASALRHRPDAVILDLEDAIAPEAKAAARAALPAAQAALAAAGIPCVLRVNASLAAMVQDLAAADPALLHAVMLPKCADPRPLLNAAELTGGTLGLIALIESPAALPNLHGLAAVPQCIGLMLGPEDYATTLGADPNRGALDLPVAHIASAAAPRGLMAMGFPGSIANFRDLDLYAAQIAKGRDLGMNAVAAIHPAQLPVIRAAFAPTEAQRQWATALLAKAETEGVLFQRDGAMVDAPVITRARTILARS
jgi:citrate lyase subunit beta/citryl-CoA lyase